MGDPTRRRATYEDVLHAPEHMIAEVIDGELSLMPRPSSLHTVTSSMLGGELTGPFWRGRGGPGGWILLDEPELHPGEDILVPDLAGWRRTRMPEVSDQAFFTLSPDWVCEVVSPSSGRSDRVKKPRIYAREKIPYFWRLDPIEQSLEVMRLEGAYYATVLVAGGKESVRAEPFDAIELSLSVLWGE